MASAYASVLNNHPRHLIRTHIHLAGTTKYDNRLNNSKLSLTIFAAKPLSLSFLRILFAHDLRVNSYNKF